MQPSPAQLVAAIVAADDRPLYRIESEAGIAAAAIADKEIIQRVVWEEEK